MKTKQLSFSHWVANNKLLILIGVFAISALIITLTMALSVSQRELALNPNTVSANAAYSVCDDFDIFDWDWVSFLFDVDCFGGGGGSGSSGGGWYNGWWDDYYGSGSGTSGGNNGNNGGSTLTCPDGYYFHPGFQSCQHSGGGNGGIDPCLGEEYYLSHPECGTQIVGSTGNNNGFTNYVCGYDDNNTYQCGYGLTGLTDTPRTIGNTSTGLSNYVCGYDDSNVYQCGYGLTGLSSTPRTITGSNNNGSANYVCGYDDSNIYQCGYGLTGLSDTPRDNGGSNNGSTGTTTPPPPDSCFDEAGNDCSYTPPTGDNSDNGVNARGLPERTGNQNNNESNTGVRGWFNRALDAINIFNIFGGGN